MLYLLRRDNVTEQLQPLYLLEAHRCHDDKNQNAKVKESRSVNVVRRPSFAHKENIRKEERRGIPKWGTIEMVPAEEQKGYQ